MEIELTSLSGVVIIKPKVFGDSRGYFFESFQFERYQEAGIDLPFVQDNVSHSEYGVLRGLHYQLNFPQGKLVTVIRGKVFDVAVDVRQGSPTFGQWSGVELSDENQYQFYVPPGFAHGFCVLSEMADFHYKCTEYYHPEDDHSIIWNDFAIGIEWPLTTVPKLSEKDCHGCSLLEKAENLLPKYGKS